MELPVNILMRVQELHEQYFYGSQRFFLELAGLALHGGTAKLVHLTRLGCSEVQVVGHNVDEILLKSLLNAYQPHTPMAFTRYGVPFDQKDMYDKLHASSVNLLSPKSFVVTGNEPFSRFVLEPPFSVLLAMPLEDAMEQELQRLIANNGLF